MASTTRILHMSDLHLLPTEVPDHSPPTYQYVERVAAMTRAIRDCIRRDGKIDVVAMTGDIIDTAEVTTEKVIAIIRHLVASIRDACGSIPILLVPGNHDRRRIGLLESDATALNALRKLGAPPGAEREPDMMDQVWIVTADDPIGVLRLPGVALPFVLNDSTFLDHGWVSAGGTVRSEDVLCVASQLETSLTTPVIWLMHHHLVPTPITDLEIAGSGEKLGAVREWVQRKALALLSRVVSNIDHEELTMTAMGAGTVLTSLQALGRPVVVLHGHKHYPTARVLRGTRAYENDVALLSAGTAGGAEYPSSLMSIWPSFNLIEATDDGADWVIKATTTAFAPPGRPTSNDLVYRRDLVEIRTEGAHWAVIPIRDSEFEIDLEYSRSRLSIEDGGNALNLVAERQLRVREGGRLDGITVFREKVAGLPRDAELIIGNHKETISPTTMLPIPIVGRGGSLNYKIVRALTGTAKDATREYGTFTPYEWVGLPNRRGSAEATLELCADSAEMLASAFGSLTDLTTGQEQPRPLEKTLNGWKLKIEMCPPRSLLRIYWRLPNNT